MRMSLRGRHRRQYTYCNSSERVPLTEKECAARFEMERRSPDDRWTSSSPISTQRRTPQEIEISRFFLHDGGRRNMSRLAQPVPDVGARYAIGETNEVQVGRAYKTPVNQEFD